MTAEEHDDVTLRETRSERTLVHLKRTKGILEAKGKSVVFLTENLMLLLRACTAHINNCPVQERLNGRVPDLSWKIWSLEDRVNEIVLIQ